MSTEPNNNLKGDPPVPGFKVKIRASSKPNNIDLYMAPIREGERCSWSDDPRAAVEFEDSEVWKVIRGKHLALVEGDVQIILNGHDPDPSWELDPLPEQPGRYYLIYNANGTKLYLGNDLVPGGEIGLVMASELDFRAKIELEPLDVTCERPL